MGDRTWAHIKIGGHLETIDQAEDLIAAMTEDAIADNEQDGRRQLRRAVEMASYIYYEGDDVNYGIFPAIDAFVECSPKLNCNTAFGNGGGYDSGSKTVYEGKVYQFEGRDGGLISRKALRELLNSQGLEAALAHLDEADRLEFDPVQKMTASPAVAAYLKIFAGKAA